MMEIAPGIYTVKVPIPDNPLGYLNCYVIEGKEGWLMVDTGWHTPEALNSLREGLKEIGLAFTDIATIVLTHVHADHFGLAGRIRQFSPNTKLFAHQWETALIESRYIKFADLRRKMAALLRRHGVPQADIPSLESASMPAMEFVVVTMPDEPLFGGEIIDTGRFQLETIWTPGHSPGHICLYEPKNQLFFAGDHILSKITPNVSYHVQSGDDPLGDYVHSLKKVQNLPVTKVLPAHETIFSDLSGRIEEILLHHNNRKEEIINIIRLKPALAYEIASRLTWDVPMNWDRFGPQLKRGAVTETIAHLENMRREGTIKRISQGELFLYANG